MKKIATIIGAIALLCALLITIYARELSHDVQTDSKPTVSTSTNSTNDAVPVPVTGSAPIQLPQTTKKNILAPGTISSSAPKEQKVVSVSFEAGETRQSIVVPQGSTAFDVMRALVSTTPFKFIYTKYSGLGYFIEEINGIKNDGGTYWTFYVDGEYSPVGASNYYVHEGDKLLWKYEKK